MGKEFKNIFEELVKHLNTQRIEAEELRKSASSAAKAAIFAETEFSARLDACLIDERLQAAKDRSEILLQITELITKSGEKQDSRWESKISTIRNDIAASSSNFRTADNRCNESMDLWLQNGSLLVEEVLKSKETLKSKMKKDWTVSAACSYPGIFIANTCISRLSMNIIPQFRLPHNLCTKRQFASSTLR